MPSRKSSDAGLLSALLITLLFNAVVLAHFHDRFWWPPDEGVYAHTAERLLHGEVLNADVEEIHTGYIHFLHVAAFSTFGVELVSLRYPLAAASFIQSCVLFVMFARYNLLVAVVAACSATAMGVIQFLSPQPSWYCLLLVTLAALCLTDVPPQRKWRNAAVGLLIGLIYFFRQITGVFAAMGVLTYLLTETKEEGDGRGALIARGLLALMLFGTVLYLLSATNLSGWLLIGIWPVAYLGHAFVSARTTNRRSAAIALELAVGFLASALPILIYHTVHGSLRAFVDDTILRAFDIQQLSYLTSASYTSQQSYALARIRDLESFHTVVNGVFWLLLPFGMLVTGAFAWRAFARYGCSREVGALPVLAGFYALVALFQQIPIYLFYVLPLTWAGLFWLSLRSRRTMWMVGAAAVLFSSIAIYYQAGQPASRLIPGIIRGERVDLVPADTLERVGLWVDRESLDVYTEVVRVIRENSHPDEAMFALPYNPELYFLAQRRNPFRFWNTAVGVRSTADEDLVLELIENRPPRVIVVAPRDRNNTPQSNEIIARVREKYSLIGTIGAFEVYRAAAKTASGLAAR